jgi:hypothetical protein
MYNLLVVIQYVMVGLMIICYVMYYRYHIREEFTIITTTVNRIVDGVWEEEIDVKLERSILPKDAEKRAIWGWSFIGFTIAAFVVMGILIHITPSIK